MGHADVAHHRWSYKKVSWKYKGNLQENTHTKVCFATFLSHTCNFIEITLRHACSPLNLLRILRTPFSQSTSGGMSLDSTD